MDRVTQRKGYYNSRYMCKGYKKRRNWGEKNSKGFEINRNNKIEEKKYKNSCSSKMIKGGT